MNRLTTLAALSALLIATPAMADDAVTNKTQSTYQPAANGGYEAKESVEHTNANGTTTTHVEDKKVDVDSHGNKETNVDVKNTTDPKGLLNKSTTEVHNKAVVKDGTSEYSHKKTVDGKVVEESNEKQQ